MDVTKSLTRIFNPYDTLAVLSRSFLGESMDPESTMAYAYYKDGGSSPTFLFCKYALDAVKM